MAAYQREWSWVDKQNFVDSVDADDINAAYQGIGREFDKLAQLLQGGEPPPKGLPKPDYDSQMITLVESSEKKIQIFPITHRLNSLDLLVDIKVMNPVGVLTPSAVAIFNRVAWIGGDLGEWAKMMSHLNHLVFPTLFPLTPAPQWVLLTTYQLLEDDPNTIEILWGVGPPQMAFGGELKV